MGHIMLAHWSNLRRKNCCNGYRTSIQSHKFHLKGFTLTMKVHDCADISSLKPFLRYVHSQNYSIMFSYHGGCYKG